MSHLLFAAWGTTRKEKAGSKVRVNGDLVHES